jgi:hypothetical protein
MTRIPSTISAAQSRLTAIGSLLQATEWEKAAIVAAFVTVADREGRPSRETATSSSLSPTQFAALGITGLKSKDTVRRYHDAWMDHSGYERPEPGMEIPTDLPEWGATVPQVTNSAKIATAPGTIAQALEDPELAAKVVARMTPQARLSTGIAVDAARDEATREHQQREHVQKRPGYQSVFADGALISAHRSLVRAAGDVRGITFTPEQQEHLCAELDRIDSLTAMIRRQVLGITVTDWDTELANLTGGTK